MEADASIAVVFRCLEEFLRKAGSMNVFDTLVYNYRLKDEFLNSERLGVFSTILLELIQNLTHLRKEIDKMSFIVEASQLATSSACGMSTQLTTLHNNVSSSEESQPKLYPITISTASDNVTCSGDTNSLEKKFINMITLDGSNCYYPVEGTEEFKNGSVGVVVSDFQTLFSVQLDSTNTDPSTTIQQVCNNVFQNIPITNDTTNSVMTETTSNSSVELTECQNDKSSNNIIDDNSVHNKNTEVFLIPILKEIVKPDEELSINNICSMLDSNFESASTDSHINSNTGISKAISNSEESVGVSQKKPHKQEVKIIKTQTRRNDAKAVIEEIDEDETLLFYCCDKCFHSFKTQEGFNVHKCTTNSKGVNSGKSSTLIEDNAGLRNMKKFVCGLCLEEYRNLDRISFHLKRCEGGPFTCEMCPPESPQFPTMKALYLHKQQDHKEERSFVCRDCGFPFKFKCSLQKHKLRAHNNELQPRTFPCDLCPNVFMKKIFLTNHKVKNHNIEREFLCQICGQSYTTQQSLKAHIDEMHLESTKFPCDKCTKIFSRKEQLNFHMATHTGIPSNTPHLCETCGKGFSKKNKLDDHFKRRHTVGPALFSCAFPNCSKAFRTKSDQKSHFKRMHGIGRHLKDKKKELGEDGQPKKKKKDKKKLKIKDNNILSAPEIKFVPIINDSKSKSNGENNQRTSQDTEPSGSHKLSTKLNEETVGSSQTNTAAPSCDTELSSHAPDEIVISDFLNALTPGQLEQMIQSDFLVPTLIP